MTSEAADGVSKAKKVATAARFVRIATPSVSSSPILQVPSLSFPQQKNARDKLNTKNEPTAQIKTS